jgi:hypothetical protein
MPVVVIRASHFGQRTRFAGDSSESVFRIIMHLPFIRTSFDGSNTTGPTELACSPHCGGRAQTGHDIRHL